MNDQYQQLEDERIEEKVATAKIPSVQYDPDKIPPNWKHAEEHEQARLVGIEINPDELQGEVNICDCCGYQVQRRPLSLQENPIKLSFLGAGFPLFFEFIKYCIYILIIIFLTSGVYNIISNISSDDCIDLDKIYSQNSQNLKYNFTSAKDIQKDPKLCFSGFSLNLSIANKKLHGFELFLQQCINLITIIAIIILLQFFRRNQRIVNELADKENISPSDYTLMLKKIKENPEVPLDYDQELKTLMMEKGIPGKTANVVKINLCFDLTEILKYQKLKDQAIRQYQQAILHKQKHGSFPENKEDKFYLDNIAEQEKQLENLEEVFAEGQTEHFCGTAFVSFNTEQEKDEVYEAHGQLSDLQKITSLCNKQQQFADHDLVFLGGKIVVEQAPEPNDILWHNQNVTTLNKVIRRVVADLITVSLLIGSFFLILELNRIQIKLAQKEKKANFLFEKLIAFAISMCIICVNIIISFAIRFMASFEAYSTVTRQNISIAKKNIIVQFFNTAFILFVVSYWFKQNIIGIGGLISNITMMFFTNMIFPPLKESVSPFFILNRIKLWMAKKKSDTSVLTQSQANKMHEKPEFPIAVCYGQVLNAMYFASFYAPIIPIGVLFSILLLVALYWVYKYNLLRRTCVLHSQSAELSIEMTEMLEFICVIFSASNWIFVFILKQIKSQFQISENDLNEYDFFINIISIIGFVLGLLNAFLPMQNINEKLFDISKYKAPALSQTYHEVEHDFDTNYDVENPATEERAKEERVNKFENSRKNQA